MKKTSLLPESIEYIVNHYNTAGEFPLRMDADMHRMLAGVSRYPAAGIQLLKKAAKHDMITQVGQTFASVARHSDDYTAEFLSETDKLMTAYGRHSDLPHVLAVGFGKFFPNPHHFSTLAHALDGTAVTNALHQYHDNNGDYRTLTSILQNAATRHKTSSPLCSISQALTQQKLLDSRKDYLSHPSYNIVSNAIMQTAGLTKDPEVTAYLADVAYRHIDCGGMHFMFDIVISNARKSSNPTEYIPKAIAKYDGKGMPARIRRHLYKLANLVIATQRSHKPAA